jgi:hypothetical protein
MALRALRGVRAGLLLRCTRMVLAFLQKLGVIATKLGICPAFLACTHSRFTVGVLSTLAISLRRFRGGDRSPCSHFCTMLSQTFRRAASSF